MNTYLDDACQKAQQGIIFFVMACKIRILCNIAIFHPKKNQDSPHGCKICILCYIALFHPKKFGQRLIAVISVRKATFDGDDLNRQRQRIFKNLGQPAWM